MEIYKKGNIAVDADMIMNQLLLNSELCSSIVESMRKLETRISNLEKAMGEVKDRNMGNISPKNPYLKIVTKK